MLAFKYAREASFKLVIRLTLLFKHFRDCDIQLLDCDVYGVDEDWRKECENGIDKSQYYDSYIYECG